MKSMSVGEFKAHFSDAIEAVKSGESIAVTYGKKKEIVGYFQPTTGEPKKKRKLGLLEGKVKVVFAKDFKMTEEEFINL